MPGKKEKKMMSVKPDVWAGRNLINGNKGFEGAGAALLSVLPGFLALFLVMPLAVADEDGFYEPDLKAEDIREANIDAEHFEVGPFLGFISVEDFEVGALFGGRVAFHANETLFLEASVGLSSDLETAFERLSGSVQLIPDDEKGLLYYQVSAGMNVLPGEFFWRRKRAWNMAWYVLGGVGATDFGGDTSFTIHGGTGIRWLVSDWIAIHTTMQLQAYDTDLLGESETAINLSWIGGVSFFF